MKLKSPLKDTSPSFPVYLQIIITSLVCWVTLTYFQILNDSSMLRKVETLVDENSRENSSRLRKVETLVDENSREKPSTRPWSINCARIHSNQQMLFRHELTKLEEDLIKKNSSDLKFIDPFTCKQSGVSLVGDDIREGLVSDTSKSSNRIRQVAVGIHQTASIILNERTGDSLFGNGQNEICLMDLKKKPLSIYNTDTYSPIHEVLSKMDLEDYVSSEYVPECAEKGEPSGTIRDGIRHEDLQKLSFDNNSYDMVISSEVFEHIPFPYDAHREVHRILKPGGAHVFTVPYAANEKNDIVMSQMDRESGKIKHGPGQPPHHVSPEYHGDAMRSKGILVFTIFGNEMLRNLCDIGFDVQINQIYSPDLGIVGSGAIVFTAWKIPEQ